MKSFYDIIIIGGGIVGATFACAIAKQTSLSIAILEAKSATPNWTQDHYHHRVSAIALSSQRIFASLQVWSDMHKLRVSPFTKIAVWDAQKEQRIVFDSADMAEPVLGFIIENNLIQSVLEKKIKHYPQIHYIAPAHLTGFRKTQHGVEIEMDGEILAGALAVAADGAHSWLRTQAGIAVDKQDYKQTAIVTTIKTSLPHQQMARQIFLETGPLAFLPLTNSNISSIVWTLPTALAQELQENNDKEFKTRLSQAFPILGDILEVEKRHLFPLYKQQAKKYLQAGVALIGDAAHVIHPLAGQGVNMGLLDAASLSDVIVQAHKQRRHFAEFSVLRRYERWRKADNFAMCAGVDLLSTIFASDKKIMQSIGSTGLNLVNQMPSIKTLFMRRACGDRNDLPSLAIQANHLN